MKGTGYCYECVAKKNLKTESKDLRAEIYKKRQLLMDNKSYKPIYFGKALSDYYDGFDARSFDIELASIEEAAESPDELFYES